MNDWIVYLTKDGRYLSLPLPPFCCVYYISETDKHISVIAATKTPAESHARQVYDRALSMAPKAHWKESPGYAYMNHSRGAAHPWSVYNIDVSKNGFTLTQSAGEMIKAFREPLSAEGTSGNGVAQFPVDPLAAIQPKPASGERSKAS